MRHGQAVFRMIFLNEDSFSATERVSKNLFKEITEKA